MERRNLKQFNSSLFPLFYLKRNNEWDDELRLCREVENNIKLPIYSHRNPFSFLFSLIAESIDKKLLSPVWCKGLIIKQNKCRAKFISEFFSVPKTTIPFDPYDIAEFNLTRPKQIPATIKDEHLKILWEWAINDKSIHSLGLHPMQMNRIVRKFVKQVLESEYLKQKT